MLMTWASPQTRVTGSDANLLRRATLIASIDDAFDRW
jgi:hypothetical protein